MSDKLREQVAELKRRNQVALEAMKRTLKSYDMCSFEELHHAIKEIEGGP